VNKFISIKHELKKTLLACISNYCITPFKYKMAVGDKLQDKVNQTYIRNSLQ